MEDYSVALVMIGVGAAVAAFLLAFVAAVSGVIFVHEQRRARREIEAVMRAPAEGPRGKKFEAL